VVNRALKADDLVKSSGIIDKDIAKVIVTILYFSSIIQKSQSHKLKDY